MMSVWHSRPVLAPVPLGLVVPDELVRPGHGLVERRQRVAPKVAQDEEAAALAARARRVAGRAARPLLGGAPGEAAEGGGGGVHGGLEAVELAVQVGEERLGIP